MKDREQFVEVSGFVIPEDKALAFVIQSIKGDEWFGAKINRDKKNAIEMIFKDSFGYFKPLGPNKTLFKLFMNADPQLEYIPPGIIDWGIKTITGGFLSYLLDACTNLPSMYSRRYLEKKEHYDMIKD